VGNEELKRNLLFEMTLANSYLKSIISASPESESRKILEMGLIRCFFNIKEKVCEFTARGLELPADVIQRFKTLEKAVMQHKKTKNIKSLNDSPNLLDENV
jgi:hypothetical protein